MNYNEVREQSEVIRAKYMRTWNKHFAWYPVLTEDRYIAWLTTVYRCRRYRAENWRYLADVHNVMVVADASRN